MKESKKTNPLYIYGPIILSLGILFWLIAPSFGKIMEVLKNSDNYYLAVSLALSCLSYVFMGFTLWETLKIMGYKMPFWDVTGIAVVSTSVNYFVSSAGISGFAARTHLLKKRRIPYAISVTSSVVITVLIYFVLALIIFQGILLNLFSTRKFNIEFFEGIFGVFLILFISGFLVLLFFHNKLRASWSKKLYVRVSLLMYYFSRKRIARETFKKFQNQLDTGIEIIQKKKFELPKIIAYIALDWIFTIYILHFAFKAIGVDIGTSQLIIGFSFGMLMTIIPILPGGLGAMEAAMTAAFSQMGIVWHEALAAALIFRVFYYLLPSLISVFLYWGLKISEPYYNYLDNKIKKLKHSLKEKK